MEQKSQFEIEFLEAILRRDESYPEVLEMLAGLYTKDGRIDDGLALDRRLVELHPDNPTNHYNLACSLALKDRKPEAVQALRRSIELGYSDFPWMLKDPDLKELHSFPPFRELLAEYEIQR